MSLTPTCPELRPDQRAGVPADPESDQYDRAARDALAFAALSGRFIQNLCRYPGYDRQCLLIRARLPFPVPPVLEGVLKR